MNIQARLIAGLVALLLGVGIGWWINGERWALKLESAVEGQQKVDMAECAKDKQITKEANDDLQKNLDAVSARLAAFKRLRIATCIPMFSAGETDVAKVHAGYASEGGRGLSTDWLHEYFAECEAIRQVELSCDRFTDDERAK